MPVESKLVYTVSHYEYDPDVCLSLSQELLVQLLMFASLFQK